MTQLTSNNASLPVIVSTANDKYSLPLAAMIKSIELTLREEEQVIVYIFYTRLKSAIKDEIDACCNSGKIDLRWLLISPEQTDGLKTSFRWTTDVYDRILIADMLPELDKVIYLDADVIVKRSLYDLWAMDIEKWHLLAIPHATKEAGYVQGKYGIPAYKIMGIPENTITFNSGVLVMNLKLWRRDDTANAIFAYLRVHQDKILWLDQDAMNVILYDKWLAIPYEWNIQVEEFQAALVGIDSFITQRQCMSIMVNPAIIHYAGGAKPWMNGYHGLYKDDYTSCAELLPESLKKICGAALELNDLPLHS